MKIRKFLAAVLGLAMLLFIVLSIVTLAVSDQLNRLSERHARAQHVVKEVSDLLVLTNEMALHGEERSFIQWRTHHKAISETLQLASRTETEMTSQIVLEADRLTGFMNQLSVAMAAPRNALHDLRIGLLFDQLLNHTQALSDSVHRWSENLGEQHLAMERRFHTVVVTLPILFLLGLTGLSFIIYRRVLVPLAKLHRSMEAVATGDLTARSAIASDDELGQISRTFDALAIDLVTQVRQSEKKFSQIFHALPMSGVIYRLIRDEHDEIIDWELHEINELGAADLRKPPDELIGRHARALMGDKVFQPYLDLCRAVVASDRPRYIETHFDLNSKDYLTALFLIGTDFYAQISIDITQRKQAETELEKHRSHLEELVAKRTNELAQQKFFLEDLIATLPCGVYRLRHKAPASAAEWADVDHPPHVQDLSSDTYCRLLGISREEAEATQGGVIARIHPDDLDQFLRRVELSNTALTPFTWEGRMRIGGETRWMRFDAIPRRIDDEIVVSGIVQNIDEQRKHSSLIYRSVVEATPDAFVAIDENSRIIEWSSQAETMFGYAAAEAIGMPLSDTIIPASHVAEHDYHLKQFVGTGRDGAIGKRRRVTARRRNGSEFPVELQIMALRLDDHWRFTSFIRDISDVVAAEQRLAQAQKLEAIGQLTGGLAHDFNNLLGIVVGNLELLKEGVAPEEMDVLIDAAFSAASRGVGVTRSLLAVARRSNPMPVVADVNALLGELGPLLRQTAGRRINVFISPHAERAHSVIDSSAFSNALLNLVINARDAMPNGGDLLIYSYSMYLELPRADDIDRVELPEGLYVVIGVDDQGSGMDPDMARKAVEPFFTTKNRGKGTGLGLPMVSAFATRSGGRVRIESTPGKGSSVQIILPVSPGHEDKQQRGEPATSSRGPIETNGRLLLVDDEIDLLKITGRWLKNLGYQVATVESAAAALAILDDRKFDLLLTDIVMPGEMDGLALARIAASRYPEMKIILTSGYPENITEDDKRRWVLVEKPASRAVLADAVAVALGFCK